MHYWIYQDSRILGPFAREDVLSVPGVGQGSLVCEGSATGAADQDWKPLDSVPELAGLLGSRAIAAAVMPSELDSFGQFQETAHALLDNIGRSDEYPSAVLQDPQFSALWGGLGGDPGGGIWDRHRVSDLETSVFDLKSQLEEQVKRQDEMLEKLSEKQKLIEEKEQLLAEREKEAELLRGRLRDAVVQPLGGTAPADGVSELRARIAQLESRQGSPAAPTDPITGLLARIAQLEARGAAPLPPADPVAELSSRLADLEARARGGAAQPRPAGHPAARAPASRPPPPPPAAFQEETPPWTSSPDLGELPPPAESAPRDGAPWGSAAAAPAFLEEAAAAPSVPDFKPVPLSEDLGLPPMRARTEDVPQFEAPPPLAEESGAAPSAEASWTPPPVEESPAPTTMAPVAAAPAPVSDAAFERIVILYRLSVPSAGVVVSTREPAALRERCLDIGATQVSAGSKMDPGGYGDGVRRHESEQFEVDDTRPIEEMVRVILRRGYLPSLCTSCYRRRRTGNVFTEMALDGHIKEFCLPNALLTLAEYAVGNADPALRDQCLAAVAAGRKDLDDSALRPEFDRKLSLVLSGAKDLFF